MKEKVLNVLEEEINKTEKDLNERLKRNKGDCFVSNSALSVYKEILKRMQSIFERVERL